MSSQGDQVVIIGGGVIGLCTALELANAGRAVTVIDRGDMTASASCGNAGLIAMGHPPLPRPGLWRQSLKFLLDATSPLYFPPRFDPALVRWLWSFRRACAPEQFHRSMRVLASLSRLSMQRFDEFAADSEFDFEFRPDGLIDVCLSERGMEHLLHDTQEIAAHGFRYEVLDGAHLRAAEPAYLDSVCGGVLYPDSASASPGLFMRALRQRAEERGVTIRTCSVVQSIEHEGRRFRSVDLTTGERIAGETLIIAAGVWTSGLARQLGGRIPMQPAKGYHVMLRMNGEIPRRAGVLSESFIAATPMDGMLRLAGTLEFSGINHRFRRRRVDMLTTGARKYLRGIDDATMTSVWCGLRPCTADGLPVIGPLPGFDNIIIATGHAMLGFGLGPATGVLVQRIAMGEDVSVELDSLSATRFL